MPRDLRLTQFTQTIQEIGMDDAYRIVPFDGAVAAILVREPNTLRILTQSGEAVAWGAVLNAPAPLFPTTLIGRKDVTKTRVGPKEYKTTWSYVMALDASDTYDATIHTRWPTDPATTPGFTNLT
jgi:hypothetical protein